MFTKCPSFQHPIFIDPPYIAKSHKRRHLIAQLITAIVLMLAGALAIQHKAHAAEYPNSTIEEPTPDIKTGELQLISNGKQTFTAVHLDTQINTTISGLIAEVTYHQSFYNPTEQWLEGRYAFPLPENASVNHMTMQIGERKIVGKIMEKEAALKTYEKAKTEGKHAALTQQNRPNLFTQQVANIAPKQTITVTLRYIQSVDYRHGQFSWRLPTTFTPRYTPEMPRETTEINPSNYADTLNETRESKDISQMIKTDAFGWSSQTLNNFIDTEHSGEDTKNNTASITVELNSGLTLTHIDAPYHDIVVNKHDGIHFIKLSDSRTKMDRDFVLQWQANNETTPKAAVFTQTIDDEHYAYVMLLPPQNLSQQTRLPKDTIFIIDTSGSMDGTSIKQAKASLNLALEQLEPNDRFNIIEFNSTTQTLFDDLTDANNESINYARHWVQGLNATGGTEMLPALQAAFNHDSDSDRLRQIIFITDGAISNESQLFKEIADNLTNARLFTIGIGSAPNSFFMRKAAQFGRGTYTYIANVNEVEQKMAALFETINNATHRNISINWGTHTEQYPSAIGDIYIGEPILVSAKLSDSVNTILISGDSVDGSWNANLDATQGAKAKQKNSGISTVWARAKIEQLEDNAIARSVDSNTVKSDIIAVALKHQLLSRFTSFIAVEQKSVRKAQDPIIITDSPNLIPQGQKLQQINYPQTGTWAALSWWTGMLCFFGYLIVRAIRHEP